MAMLRPLGMEKGKPFKPDARQQTILEDAAVRGDAMARNVMTSDFAASRVQPNWVSPPRTDRQGVCC
jgi:hypothetical protein